VASLGAVSDEPPGEARTPAPRRRPRRTLRRIRSQAGWIAALAVVGLFTVAVVAVANGRGAKGKPVGYLADVATSTTAAPPVIAPRATVKGGSTTAKGGAPTAPPGIPTQALSALPPEAAATWQLIGRGGPFPHAGDGNAFENVDRRLPVRAAGWYWSSSARTARPSGRPTEARASSSSTSPAEG
jgi:ribonuclease T1